MPSETELLSAAAAQKLNQIARANEAARRLAPGFARFSGSASFDHPWQTRASRFGEGAWKLRVAPGTVNDQLALFSYLKTGDPRGWVMPAGYLPPSEAKIFGTNYPIVDRSPFERDDPPFLLVRAPSADGQVPGDFERVSAAGRPSFFTGAGVPGVSGLGRVGGATNKQVGPDITAWPLYRAYVIVSASPYRASRDFTIYRADLTVQLQRFRVFAGRKPVRSDNVLAGGWCELARLFLLRNPEKPLTDDKLYVQQLRFWCLQSVAVQPTFELGGIEQALNDSLGDALTSVILGSVQSDLQSAATVEFWTA